ncbi:MgtC/SapB family protein [Chitinophaga sp. MM2321]|uniref:MgtC/SapB family protein n=1 Tax=Chitinophaga sp. MM2321 TaxID=3137178 RepID=UPI0032D5740D
MSPFVLSPWETILRLVISAILGSLVGWDRQRKEGAAGLRTHMLVSVGSTLVMIVSTYGFEDILGQRAVMLDPSRIAAQVISGIGFLGAGTILFLRQQVVKGLTTAAGLWSVAAVGLAVGSGLYLAAVFTTVIILLILAVVKPLEKKFFKSEKLNAIYLVLDLQKVGLLEIEAIIKSKGIEITEMIMHSNDDGSYQIKMTFESGTDQKLILAVTEQLNSTPGISRINLKI